MYLLGKTDIANLLDQYEPLLCNGLRHHHPIKSN